MNRILLTIVAVFLNLIPAQSQCTTYPVFATTQQGSDQTFCIDGATNTLPNITLGAQRYVTLNVIKGYTYTFAISNIWDATGGSDIEYLGLFDDAAGNALLAQSPSANNGTTITSWVATISGKVRILLLRGYACVSTADTATGTLVITQNSIGNIEDDQTLIGPVNTWRGHIYNWTGGVPPGGTSPSSPSNTNPFLSAQYAGYYNVGSESINQGFGGSTNCFNVLSNGVQRASIYTEQFAVRYRMRSTRPAGCYLVNVQGDDGVRLYVDNVRVFNEWKQQSPTIYGSLMVYLNGNSDIILDYYENGGQNQVSFSIAPFVPTTNTVTTTTPSTVCSGVIPGPINGSPYTYNGNSVNPTINYQWQSSTDDVTFTNISGATLEDYTPAAITNGTASPIVTYYRRKISAAATAASCDYYSTSVFITTNPGSSSAPVATAGTTATCTGLTANWNAVSGAASYTLDVSTSNSFATFVGVYNNLDVGNVVFANITGLTAGTQYYYRLRAVFPCSVGNLSNVINYSTLPPTPATPGVISGTSQCPSISHVYSITAVTNATTYTWTVPSGWVINSGQGSVSINVTSPSAGPFTGNITVTAGNTCGTSAAQTLSIVPATPGTITGTAIQCPSLAGQVYSIAAIANASSYNWTVPTGWTVTSGAGTTSITVTTGTAGGTVSVSALNTCAASVVRNLAVTVNANLSAVAVTPIVAQNICVAASGSVLTVAPTGGGAMTYQWGKRSVSGGAITTIAGQSAASYTPTGAGLTAGTWLIVCTSTPTCGSAIISNEVTVTVNANLSAAAVTPIATQNICFSASGSALTVAPTGGGAVTYQWGKRSVSGGVITTIAGQTAASYTPSGTGLTAGTWLIVCTSTPTCGSAIISNEITITVNPTPTLTGATQPTFACDGSGATIDLSGLLASSTSTITYTINGGSTQTFTGVVADGSGAASFTTGVLATGNDGQTLQITGVTTTSATPNCAASFAQNVTLSVKSDSGGISLNGVSYASNTITTYCASNTAVFSITPVTGAASYIWSYPADWVAVGSQVGSTITLTTGATSGTVSVRADNLFCPSYLGVTLSTIPPSAPAFSKTDATCAVPTGTITVTSPAPAAGTVFTVTGTSPAVPSVTNTTGVFSGLTAGNYIVTYQQGSGCVSTSTAAISIVPLVTNTWNGTVWSTGSAPTSNELVVFDADYTITTTALNACSCTINSGKNIVVGVPGAANADAVLKIENALDVLGSGKITFENNASLVQVNNTSVNTGNIHYKRNTSAIKDFDYVYWSSPVAGQTLGALSPSSDKYWSWNIDNWAPVSGVMAKGQGYIARVPRYTSVQMVEFMGVPFNGVVNVPSQGNTKGNLVGNPYPSAIDGKMFINANKTSISGTLYFWTHNTLRVLNPTGTQYVYASNDYASLNLSGGVQAGSAGTIPDGNIAAGQSFFVIGTGGGNLVFNNSMRIGASGSNSLFFKQSNTKKTENTERHRVWLNLTNSGGAFKQLLVGYITGASNGFDKSFDGLTYNGNSYVDFYSINESKNYTIQGRGLPFDPADEVPLGYKTSIAGTFQITINSVDGDLVNQKVYLEDKMTNSIHDLTTGSYSFTTAIGEFKDRFVLRYTNTSKLGTGDFDSKGKGVIVSVNNSQIKINSFDKTISSVKVYDLKGSLLYEKSKVDKNEFVIDHLNSSNQFMIVMVQLEDGKWISEEIIFHD